MKPKPNTFAYIDGANLHRGVKSLGWKMDYGRFRTWLADKYGVSSAYIFIGYVSKNRNLYTYLQKAGFTLVFKDVVYDGRGKVKGNCDADLIVQVMRDSFESKNMSAVLVSSDGDYQPLIEFLQERGQIKDIVSPAPAKKCSVLLKRTQVPIVYINDQKRILKVQKEKAPGRDGLD